MEKLFTSIVFATIFSAGFAQSCDTLFNLSSIKDTPVIYVADTGTNVGYLAGNNFYGDLVKAEGFGAIVGDTVTAAVFYFGVVKINPQDSDNAVLLAVWDNTGTSYYDIAGAPGNIFDTVTVTLRQIAQAVTAANNNLSFEGLLVNFTLHVPIPTDTIYVGVILPTTGGDTLALYTNKVPPGVGGNGWDLESDTTWGSYTDDWPGFPNGGLGNYIAVEICGAATGINTLSDDVTMKIFPNPANDQLNFEWNLNDEAEIVMYDITGSVVKSFTIQGTALNTFDIHNLAPGSYIIRVTDRQTNQQRSQLFTKIN